MQLLEFIKMLAEADWKEVLVGMIHPVYGPMIIITAFLLLLDDIQKLLESTEFEWCKQYGLHVYIGGR